MEKKEKNYAMTLYSQKTRALTFEIFCQAMAAVSEQWFSSM
jgi:hypothetical protein